jgi:hypothetical protein
VLLPVARQIQALVRGMNLARNGQLQVLGTTHVERLTVICATSDDGVVRNLTIARSHPREAARVHEHLEAGQHVLLAVVRDVALAVTDETLARNQLTAVVAAGCGQKFKIVTRVIAFEWCSEIKKDTHRATTTLLPSLSVAATTSCDSFSERLYGTHEQPDWVKFERISMKSSVEFFVLGIGWISGICDFLIDYLLDFVFLS